MKHFNFYKYSLDISHLQMPNDPSGAFGTFMSNFSESHGQNIKDTLGLDPQNIGIKKFHYNDVDTIREILALYYIRPYIEKNTNFKVPYVSTPLTLSSLFLNNMVVVQKINGKTLTNLESDYAYKKWDILNDVQKKIDQIGVVWRDCHGSNVMVSGKCIEALRKMSEKESPDGKSITTVKLDNDVIRAEILKDIHIIDFGLMKCKPGTEPYTRLEALGKKIQDLILKSENKNNFTLKKILNGIIYSMEDSSFA